MQIKTWWVITTYPLEWLKLKMYSGNSTWLLTFPTIHFLYILLHLFFWFSVISLSSLWVSLPCLTWGPLFSFLSWMSLSFSDFNYLPCIDDSQRFLCMNSLNSTCQKLNSSFFSKRLLLPLILYHSCYHHSVTHA